MRPAGRLTRDDRLIAATLVGMVSFFLVAAAYGNDGTDRCAPKETAISVDTRRSRLTLCEEGHALGDYSVVFGRGGLGKNAEGDERTPIGRYSLGPPRPSKEFGVFIPVGYPTEKQRKHGARGGAVGIHGPKRRFAWAGRANAWFNWTRGCIAVGTDREIREIADWVRRRKPKVIHIE